MNRALLTISLLIGVCSAQTTWTNIDSASMEAGQYLRPQSLFHILLKSDSCDNVVLDFPFYFTIGGLQTPTQFKRLYEFPLLAGDYSDINTVPLGISIQNQLTELIYNGIAYPRPNYLTRMPHLPGKYWAFDLCRMNPNISPHNTIILLIIKWGFIDQFTGNFINPQPDK